MSEEHAKQACPVCGEQADYYELQCTEPFTAPAPLAYKALTVWGPYGIPIPKYVLHQRDDIVHIQYGDTTRLVKMLPWNEEEWQRKQEDNYEKRGKCEHEGCDREGYACFTLFEPDEPIGFYCEEHMRENGVCPGCHQFMAGFESFDFSQTGYCEGCSEALRDGIGDGEDEDYYPGPWDD